MRTGFRNRKKMVCSYVASVFANTQHPCKNKQSSAIIRLRNVQRSHDEYLLFTRKDIPFAWSVQTVGICTYNYVSGGRWLTKQSGR
jgi:hypothetical protein